MEEKERRQRHRSEELEGERTDLHGEPEDLCKMRFQELKNEDPPQEAGIWALAKKARRGKDVGQKDMR